MSYLTLEDSTVLSNPNPGTDNIFSLKENDVMVSDDKSKAGCLNIYFTSLFTSESDVPIHNLRCFAFCARY